MFKRSNFKEYYNRFKHIDKFDMNINKFLQKKKRIVRQSCQVILPKSAKKKMFWSNALSQSHKIVPKWSKLVVPQSNPSVCTHPT